MKILKQQSEFSITKFKKGWSKFFIIQILFFFALTLSAQSEFKKIDPSFDEREDAYMNRQSKALLEQVDRVLKKHPPQHPEPEARMLGLYLLDAVLHDKYAAFRKPVQQFYRSRMESVLYEIENTTVQEGAMIWKLYNMGFIVRTKTVTLAFDLVSGITSGSQDFAMNSDEIDQIVEQCDALLITHRHQDHAEKNIAQCFLNFGLPVLSPEEVWLGEPIHSNIIHPVRDAEKLQQLKLERFNLDLVVFPGHQMRSIPNNIYLITTPEGIKIAHTGDQINEGDFMIDFEWIDHVAENHQVDVLMPIVWTMNIFRIVKGFNPKLVLPGHELELGHTVWDRLPYWGDDKYLELNYAELKASEYPVVALIWGESYHYYPKK